MYKLLALDLDGTLLMPDLSIPDAVRQRIKELQSSGVIVTLATGRMFATAVRYARDLGINAPIICYNGAMLRSADAAEPVFFRPFDIAAQQQVIDFCMERGWYVQLYNNEMIIVSRLTHDLSSDPDSRGNICFAAGDLRQRELLPSPKIMTRAKESEIGERTAILQEHFGDRLFITQSNSRLAEMMMKGVCKSSALQKLCGVYGIRQEETVVCGDSGNDLDMVRWAGRGCAMANAMPILKENADYVCENNNSLGVLEVMNKFFK